VRQAWQPLRHPLTSVLALHCDAQENMKIEDVLKLNQQNCLPTNQAPIFQGRPILKHRRRASAGTWLAPGMSPKAWLAAESRHQ